VRRLVALLLIASIFVASPPLGVVAALLYLVRRHMAVYASLWIRYAKCDVLTASASLLALALSLTAAGSAKIPLAALSLVSAYLTPLKPGISRLLSTAALALSLIRPGLLALAVGMPAAVYFAYRVEACGYMCQKADVRELDEVGFMPSLGVACFFMKGGRGVGNTYIRMGDRYAHCWHVFCTALNREEFNRRVGPFYRYLPPPPREAFSGVIRASASPRTLVNALRRYFSDIVVVMESDDVPKARLISLSRVDPAAAAAVLETVFELDAGDAALLKELLTRGRDEVASWTLRHPRLLAVLELWEGGEEPKGAVASSLRGRVGVADSLVYAYVRKIPIVTDREEVAAYAKRLGITTFLITDKLYGDFLVVGPRAVETSLGTFNVEYGILLAHLGGEFYAVEI